MPYKILFLQSMCTIFITHVRNCILRAMPMSAPYLSQDRTDLFEIPAGLKRELIALLNLSSWCLVMVERLFLAVPGGCLQFVIVVFPDHLTYYFDTNNKHLSSDFSVFHWITSFLITIFSISIMSW